MEAVNRYAVPVLFSLLTGIAMAFGHLALDTATRGAVCEERYQEIIRRLDNIDAALPRKKP